MTGDSLGDRMKGYERVAAGQLLPRTPVILRVDGKAFHTLTRDLERPWDHELVDIMQKTAKHLCEEVHGAKLAYVQSDEISVLITDYDTIHTQGWFDYQIQKMVSVGAGLATSFFTAEWLSYRGLTASLPCFDARVFNLPEAEVCNYFIWRQQDATRNSVQMLARSHFSHKECHGLSCAQLQEKLFAEKEISWSEDVATHLKRGATVVRRGMFNAGDIPRKRWIIDLEPPVFTAARNYIEDELPQPEETK